MLASILLVGGFGIVALTFVLVPLFRFLPSKTATVASQVPTNDGVAVGRAAMVQEREQSARSALQEIELDYQLGNIAEEDYNTLRERYIRRALLALKSRHDSEQDASTVAESYGDNEKFDELIEARLRKLREQDATD